jgi:hypothetical protein
MQPLAAFALPTHSNAGPASLPAGCSERTDNSVHPSPECGASPPGELYPGRGEKGFRDFPFLPAAKENRNCSRRTLARTLVGALSSAPLSSA